MANVAEENGVRHPLRFVAAACSLRGLFMCRCSSVAAERLREAQTKKPEELGSLSFIPLPSDFQPL
jgi:hypothetical protein